MTEPAEIVKEHAPSGGLLTPDVMMVVLTWATFFVLLFILKKYAFKPILENLQKREDHIRTALEDADKAKEKLAHILDEEKRILDEARAQASVIVADARKTAVSLANAIEQKAHQQGKEILDTALVDLDAQRRKVRHQLLQETADISLALAAKILKENTDTDKNRRLIQESLKDI